MNANNRHRAAMWLAKRLDHETENFYGEPVVRDHERHAEVCWDGPFEWAACLVGGADINAGELGRYSWENSWYPDLQAVEDELRVEFSCYDDCTIHVYDAYGA